MDLDNMEDEVLDQLIDSMTEQHNKTTVKSASQLSVKEPGPEHLEVLSKYFGHKSFRPMQWEIISTLLDQKRDVCAIMSTGYGKSLCFQFPSTFSGGITLVISPLIALMEDQVLSLTVANIPACLLGTAQKNQKEVIDEILRCKYRMVYLTPEFCAGGCGSCLLKELATKQTVVLIAIDEAHCISSWGHDFRFHYRQLGVLRDIFPETPIIAVTATATPRVREDIIISLKLRNTARICLGFDRPNIYFEVHSKGHLGLHGAYQDLTALMITENYQRKFNGPTIIYCITRKETEEISNSLNYNGIKSLAYHAGLKMATREEAHEQFVKDKIDVIVATIAFGMGIDKPDIRNVIHYGASKSIEGYYQEVGRAGRDGLPARCATFYSWEDFDMIQWLNEKSGGSVERKAARLGNVKDYFTTQDCRRRFILKYFDDKVDHLKDPRRDCCDICTRKISALRTLQDKYEDIDENGCYDFTVHARKLLTVVSLFGDCAIINTCSLFLRGSKSPKIPKEKRDHPMYGCGKDYAADWWTSIAKLLVAEKYLTEKLQMTNNKGKSSSNYALSITEKANRMISNNERLLLRPPPSILKHLKQKVVVKQPALWTPQTVIIDQPSTSKQIVEDRPITQKEVDDSASLYQRLLDQRTELARKLDCMPYMIASNAALMSLAKFKPKTLDDLRQLNPDGFSEAKIQKFGSKFLTVITGNSTVSTKTKSSLQDILAAHPLPQVSMTMTAKTSYSMLQSGRTMGEIAAARGASTGTIISHLISGIKCGYPIKIIELGVTEEYRDTIIRAYRKFCKTGFTSVQSKLIKDECPEEITYVHISTVMAYLQVRCHLQFLNMAYDEFEDFTFNEVNIQSCEEPVKVETDVVKTEHSYALFTENKENQDVNNSDGVLLQDSTYEPPIKKEKIHDSGIFVVINSDSE